MGYTRTTRLDDSNTISENSLWNFTKAELMEYYTIDLQPMIANCFHKDGMPVEYNNVYKSYTKEAIIEGIVKIQDLILKYQKPEAKREMPHENKIPLNDLECFQIGVSWHRLGEGAVNIGTYGERLNEIIMSQESMVIDKLIENLKQARAKQEELKHWNILETIDKAIALLQPQAEIVPKHYSDIVRQLRETQVNLDSIDDDEGYDTSELIAERDALQALLDDGDYIEFNDYE